MLDEMERSIHNSLSIVQRTLESNMVVAGGGAAEAALCVYLENFGKNTGLKRAASCC
jgi:T-complex protein 1 subunit alpha